MQNRRKWTRTNVTNRENTPKGVIFLAKETSGKAERWVQIGYISSNFSFNRGISI